MSAIQRLAGAMALGLLGGCVIALVITLSGTKVEFSCLLWIPITLALVAGGIELAVEGAEPYHVKEWVPLPAADIRAQAIRWYAANGWVLHANDVRALSFRRSGIDLQSLGWLRSIIGFLAFLCPLGRRQLTNTIVLQPVPDGTQVEMIVSARGGGGQGSVVAFFASLHELTTT